MSRGPCTATTQAGALCRAFAPDGRSFCRVHDPARAAEVQAARRRGSEKAGQLRLMRGRRAKLDNARALIRFAGDVVQDVLSGTVEPDVGRCVLYGVATLRQLVETGDLAARLEALEQRLAEQGGRKWA